MIPAVAAAVTAALAVFVGVGALSGQFSFTQRRMIARAVALERQGFDGRAEKSSGTSMLKEVTYSGSPAVNSFLRRFAWSANRAELLDRADLPLKVGEWVMIQILGFLIVGALAWLVSGLALAGLVFAIAFFLLSEVWVRGRANRRLLQFNKQLPVALQTMATSLKSGFGIMEAVQTVAREMDQPLSGEFNRVVNEARIGGSFEDSLSDMVDRVGSQDLRIAARALEIHRKVGGDLAAILESVAATMREREELRGHVHAITAQQRFSGTIVGLLPLWVVGFFLVLDPEFISPLWEEGWGRVLLLIGCVNEVLAFVIMRRVLAIEV